MMFAQPNFLFWLPALLILGIVFISLLSQRQKKLSEWINPRQWNSVIPEFNPKRIRFRQFTLWGSIFFAVLALARPQWGEREEVIRSEGMDILILLDLSNSMNAEDVPPSRLGRAQLFLKKLLAILPRDRVGIVGFAESAYLAAPLTNDFGYLTEIIETVTPGAIQNQGTNIYNAINTAIQAFQRSGETDQKTSRGVIFVTDGEDFGRGAKDVADKLKEYGAGFVVLTVGTSEGAPVPIRNDAGILQTYKKDRRGQTVMTRVNKNKAAEIAEAGGGKQLDLINPDDSALVISKLLNQWGRGSLKDQKNITKIERFHYFLATSVFLYLLHLFVGYRSVSIRFILPRIRSKLRRSTGVATILYLVFSPMAQAQPLESYLNNRKGESAYKGGDYEGAAQLYDRAHNKDKDNPVFQFNTGAALGKAKRAEEAVTHFEQSTKNALSRGDYSTAAKSLYNEGLALKESKRIEESYDRLTKAIEMARIAEDKETEKKSRDALYSAVQQQQQQKDQQKQGGAQEDPKSKDKANPSPSPQKQNEGDSEKNEQKDNKSGQMDTRKREFKSGTLSKDVAEGIMNDLSDKEKQLYNKRLKEQRGREAQNEQDW